MSETSPGQSKTGITSKRNFILGLLHGWFLAGGLAFAEPYTVLPVFVQHLSSRSWIIGLASTLIRGGGFLPQIWMARRAETLSRQKPVLILVMAVRFLSWVGIATVTAWLIPIRPQAGLVLILSLLLLFSVAGGVGAVPFQELYARLFAPRIRGRFLAWRQLGGGLLAILVGWAVKLILDRPQAFPSAYALLFGASALTMSVGFVALASLREQALEPVRREPEPWFAFLSRLAGLLKSESAFRRLLMTEMLLRTIHLCLPFLVLDLKARLDLGMGFVATALSATMAGALLSNLGWGQLADRRGNRWVILLTCALAALMLIAALLAPTAPVAIFVFFLNGAVASGTNIGFVNYLLELAPLDRRPALISLRGTLVTPLLFLSIPGGVLADRFGYGIPELLALCGILAAILMALRLPCLRKAAGDRE